MPKLKTNRGAAKRFKRTAGGGFKRNQSDSRQNLAKKSAKRKRHLRADATIAEQDVKSVRQMLPYA